MIGKNYSLLKFGDTLMKRRKACGFRSQANLAEKMVSISQDGDEYSRNIESKRKTISNWEGGKAAPSLADLIALCNILDCDIEYLIGDIDVPRKETLTAMELTGLSEKTLKTVLNLHRNNQIDWGLDTLNFLLENEKIEEFLYYLTAFSLAGNRCVEEYPLRILKKDIFQMSLNDTIKSIADDLARNNAGKPDDRRLYGFYQYAAKHSDKNGVVHSLEEIRQDMENSGLQFDPKLFEEGETIRG